MTISFSTAHALHSYCCQPLGKACTESAVIVHAVSHRQHCMRCHVGRRFICIDVWSLCRAVLFHGCIMYLMSCNYTQAGSSRFVWLTHPPVIRGCCHYNSQIYRTPLQLGACSISCKSHETCLKAASLPGHDLSPTCTLGSDTNLNCSSCRASADLLCV